MGVCGGESVRGESEGMWLAMCVFMGAMVVEGGWMRIGGNGFSCRKGFDGQRREIPCVRHD